MAVRRRVVSGVFAAGLLLGVGAVQAALIVQSNGTVYDSVQDISWDQNGNAVKTLCDANDPIWQMFDPTAVTRNSGRTKTQICDQDGRLNWLEAEAWVAHLNAQSYKGINNWRQWTVTRPDPSCRRNPGDPSGSWGWGCTGSEMGHLVNEAPPGGLGNPNDADDHCRPNCLTNTGPFVNFRNAVYWSGTEYSPSPALAYIFATPNGYQAFELEGLRYYVWAVHPGQVGPAPHQPLNDTGIDWCTDGVHNLLDCPAGASGQDGESGRDALSHRGELEKIGGGHAGFDFTKLDGHGSELPADASTWSCVRDNFTGAIWEVKTDDKGLRDKDWTYSWYDSHPPDGVPGSADGGTCATAGRCDSEKYVEDVNAQGLCGFRDWRLPTPKELVGIVDYGRRAPASIDITYFPNTQAFGRFWSSSPIADASVYAWVVWYATGYVHALEKGRTGYVRLVRASRPASLSFVDNRDGTVTDENTGLMWAQRTAYQSGIGSARGMNWHHALAYAEDATLAGYRDWRLPNVKELQSLVDYSGRHSHILEQFFPGITSLRFWSSSPDAYYPGGAWPVYGDGSVSDSPMNKGQAVRLVRAGRRTGLSPLIVSVTGSGTGAITSVPPGIDCGSDCSRVYASGATVTLNAHPERGSLFSGWGGACSGTDVCEVTMDQLQTVTAAFDLCTSCLPSRGGWRATVRSDVRGNQRRARTHPPALPSRSASARQATAIPSQAPGDLPDPATTPIGDH